MANKRGPVLALDIGGTKIAGCLVTPEGQLAGLRQLPTGAEQGGDSVMQRVIALAQDIFHEATLRSKEQNPTAIGISTAGWVSPRTGAIAFATDAILGWNGMPVRSRLEMALGLPTFIDNDGNAMALGEAVLGAGRGQNTIVGLTVGTGIGGGVIINGQVYRGAHGFSGEIGHIIIDYQGRRQCPCGRYGCMEAYASAPVMVSDFVNNIGKRRLRRELGLKPDIIGVREISDLARQGYPEALRVIQRGARHLGVGIATLLNILNPDMVVIGGGVAQIGDIYFSAVRREVQERALPIVADSPILPAQLGAQANLAGAACLAWSSLAEDAPEIDTLHS